MYNFVEYHDTTIVHIDIMLIRMCNDYVICWRWVGGELSVCYNAVDRHVAAGRGDTVALVYDSPLTDTVRRITYAELQDQVGPAHLKTEMLGPEMCRCSRWQFQVQRTYHVITPDTGTLLRTWDLFGGMTARSQSSVLGPVSFGLCAFNFEYSLSNCTQN